MKSLNITEAIKYLGDDKFAVSLENPEYRRLLYRIGNGTDKSERIGRFLDLDPFNLSYVFLSMADWHPKSTHRLLWIDHFSDGFLSQKRNFLKILGDDLPSNHLAENPGILLGPLSDELMDQLAGTHQQRTEAEELATLCILLSVGNWDAKLLTSGSTDYIEFWEGNIFFYSESIEALHRATKILNFYGLKTPTK
ncbi:hypothetical protein CLV80_104376 [Yoonia maritima]|uniref:Uncharacterized protein n=1 Tax=Yoonia maritima TaxID=1435347 RepID=A0A2T0W0X5_9RHOB|nr:hypothetical protein [Yoonia maritima]PRY78407.1 hypothetical protein CLV80_104376 [Yoonia maritima]